LPWWKTAIVAAPEQTLDVRDGPRRRWMDGRGIDSAMAATRPTSTVISEMFG
jgi:hypothetical protein